MERAIVRFATPPSMMVKFERDATTSAASTKMVGAGVGGAVGTGVGKGDIVGYGVTVVGVGVGTCVGN